MATNSSLNTNTANRVYAGISFRPEVLEYLDVLAAQMNVSRSWVLNTIVMEHAKLARTDEHLPSLLSKETPVIQLN